MQTMLSTNTEARAFYAECLDLLVASGIPFLLGGSFAVSTYTGLRAAGWRTAGTPRSLTWTLRNQCYCVWGRGVVGAEGRGADPVVPGDGVAAVRAGGL
jgi:hypothetical protein